MHTSSLTLLYVAKHIKCTCICKNNCKIFDSAKAMVGQRVTQWVAVKSEVLFQKISSRNLAIVTLKNGCLKSIAQIHYKGIRTWWG